MNQASNSPLAYELNTQQLQNLQQHGRVLRSKAFLSALRSLSRQLRGAPVTKRPVAERYASERTALQH